MRYTLLQLNQAVLSSIDGDEVNSINDTVESQQITKIIKRVYDDAISRLDLVINKTPFNLVPSGDNLKPVLMSKPDNIDTIFWIRYNCIEDGDTTPNWRDIAYVPFLDFLERTQGFDLADDNVASMDHTADGYSFTFHYQDDRGPTMYTSFDDGTILFDSYDADVDDTLQSIKTLAYGSMETPWSETNDFELELQPEQFALIVNEATSLAWAELKQQPHPKAEQSARRNWVHVQKRRQQIPDGVTMYDRAHPIHKLPDFGRR